MGRGGEKGREWEGMGERRGERTGECWEHDPKKRVE